jgi:hypothetical protein
MVIVAVVLAGGVLMGSGALAIDVGRLYVEREQLQSGADAAAMAVAKECAAAVTSCGADPDGLAKEFADGNAEDAVSGVDVLCGQTPAGALPACPPPSTTLSRCMTDPPGDEVPYVEVRTRTETDAGSTLLPATFAQLMLGNEGYDGATVGSCARAAWGPPASAGGLAVTMSACEWEASTAGGTSYAPPPPYPPNPLPAASAEQVLYLHTTATETSCPAGPSGADAPGGFGWLDESGDCATEIDADGTYSGDPGVSAPKACKEALEESRQNRTLVFVPVFDAVGGTGAGTTYHIKGMAAFVLTGYHLPGLSAESWLTGAKHCTGSNKCLYGYFTQGLVPAAGVIGGPDLGASIVALVG